MGGGDGQMNKKRIAIYHKLYLQGVIKSYPLTGYIPIAKDYD